MSQLSEFMQTEYKPYPECGWTTDASGDYVYGHVVPDVRPAVELPPIAECGLAVDGVAVAKQVDSLAIAEKLRASHQQLLTIQ